MIPAQPPSRNSLTTMAKCPQNSYLPVLPFFSLELPSFAFEKEGNKIIDTVMPNLLIPTPNSSNSVFPTKIYMCCICRDAIILTNAYIHTYMCVYMYIYTYRALCF
jgi:hypothetical protein